MVSSIGKPAANERDTWLEYWFVLPWRRVIKAEYSHSQRVSRPGQRYGGVYFHLFSSNQWITSNNCSLVSQKCKKGKHPRSCEGVCILFWFAPCSWGPRISKQDFILVQGNFCVCFKRVCPLGLFFLAPIVSVSMATTAGSDVLLLWQLSGPPFKWCSETGMIFASPVLYGTNLFHHSWVRHKTTV